MNSATPFVRTDKKDLELKQLEDRLLCHGYWHGNYFDNILEDHSLVSTWSDLANTWNDLPADEFMADGGKYRKRRFSEFRYDVLDGKLNYIPHSPFFQGADINYLNGGVDRKFHSLTPFVANHELIKEMTSSYALRFYRITGERRWRVFIHQVRITAAGGLAGLPTPEGVHKDGVTFSTLLCVKRSSNCVGAENIIYDNNKKSIYECLLSDPGELVIFDDQKVYHSVNKLYSRSDIDATRDMLFLEFTAI
ncbi:2OG-Fe dioxygenase family protein [Pseudomonas oryzihabitans]|uniref:2OG-Fe dioxygenase family protein n=1 Tax=Pseudomonas oryzihabitans TaxID=47885 RepID=UPI00285A4AEB|nr:2OG-Fe dioxygenase family protein [Pseudomonas psychrotolerans]MDR6680225.1 hypothetical protein [Pseudomonas psychrotolerans]